MFDLEDFPLLDAWMKRLLILKWNVLKWDSAYAFAHRVHVCKVNQQSSEIPLGCGKRQQQEKLCSALEMYWEKMKMTNIWVVLKKAKRITIVTHRGKSGAGMGLVWKQKLGLVLLLWIKCPPNWKTSVKETCISQGCIHLANLKKTSPQTNLSHSNCF